MAVLLCRYMYRTTIMLPEKLRLRAVSRARDRGISLGAFLRESLEMALDSSTSRGATADQLFADSAVYEGEVPADLSEDHDKYLYGETSER